MPSVITGRPDRSGPRGTIATLTVSALVTRFAAFLLVGVVGFAVNQGSLYALVDRVGLASTWASPLAIAVSMVVTFVLNALWTWRDRGDDSPLRRVGWYVAINTGGLLINWGVLVALERIGLHYLWANVVGAGMAAVWNFALNNRITWGR